MGGRGGSPNPGPQAPAAAAAAAKSDQAVNLPGLTELENRVLTNYYTAHTDPNSPAYVFIYDLHNTMSDVSMSTLQDTLKSMDRKGLIQLNPYADQKNLDYRERAAGFKFGGQLVTNFFPRAVKPRTNRNPRPDVRTPINPTGKLAAR